jgi:hypothetical protein
MVVKYLLMTEAPLWSDDEWLQALIKAVGKKAESKV